MFSILWCQLPDNRREEGIARMRQGLTAYQAVGAELFRPYFLALLAEAYGKVGQTEEGLAVLAEALPVVDNTGVYQWAAELYRLKGELVLQSRIQVLESQEENKESKGKRQKSKIPTTQHLPPSTQVEAEECFHKAIEIARRQEAKSLELRAVMSLSRLWQQQGKQKEAHQMLADVYGWFTEGFGTKDLQEAKTLLRELIG